MRVLICLILCLACWPASADPRESHANTNLVEFLGKIVHVPLEGGFYGIVAETGRRYLPLELPVEFRREDLQVRVTARLLAQRVGFQMWGQYIEILSIVPAECLNGGMVKPRCSANTR
jgi:hypothetical protein